MLSWTIHHNQSLASTQDRAIAEAQRLLAGSQSASHGTVFLAEEQTGGRGQHGRIWHSPPGGVYFSAVVPDIAPVVSESLVPIAGLAVVRSISALGFDQVMLRWPNDVLLAGKKIAGVLCQGFSQGNQWVAVVGIGVNLNTDMNLLPKPLGDYATSALAYGGRCYDRATFLLSVLQEFGGICEKTASSGWSAIAKEVNQINALVGMDVIVRTAHGNLAGMVQGIGERGSLLIQSGGSQMAVSEGTLWSVNGAAIRPE